MRSLGDASLLSLNVALTGGIPDLSINGAVRIVAYAEMLLFLGSVGANVVATGRWAISRAEHAITRALEPLRREG